jgi:hypothetical protein
MLTDWQIRLIEKPFEFEEHEFSYGKLYIKKEAVHRRLYRLDRGWTLSQPVLLAAIDDVIVLTAEMTISGVTRGAVGTGTYTRDKKADDKGNIAPLSAGELAQQKAKAYKQAATDLTVRGLKAFGAFEYIRQLPKSTNSPEKLKPELEKIRVAYHWGWNGGRERVKAKMDSLSLTWDYVAANVEPGYRLHRLTDTVLTEEQFMDRLDELAAIKSLPNLTGGGSATIPKSEAVSTVAS